MFLGIDFSSWLPRREPVHVHSVPAAVGDRVVFRPGTCSEADQLRGVAHTRRTLTDGVNGSTRVVTTLLDCHAAESERNTALAEIDRLARELEGLAREAAGLRDDRARDTRLMQGAMQIVFRMGPKLQGLLNDALDKPDLTEDGTAVRIGNLQLTVIILPFRERIRVIDNSGKVEERTFGLIGGRLSVDDQTLLLGHVTRIRQAAAEGGTDPVGEEINLVDSASVD
jgi:hypothetical protein